MVDRINQHSTQSLSPLEEKYQHLSPDHANIRLYITLRTVCFLGAVSHIIFIFFFLSIGALWLSFLNVASVLVWLIALYQNHKSRYLLATILISLEIAVHATIATLVIGLSMGFQYFLWPVASMVIIFPLFSRQLSAIISLSLIVLFGVLNLLTANFDYVYAFPSIAPYVQFINIVLTATAFVIITMSARSRSMRQEKKLYEMANKDALTQSYNRQFVYDFLKRRHQERRGQHAQNYTAVLCDIDNFKNINATIGPLAADQVIKDTSDYLQATVRGSDIVSRWGGEQFLILLMNIDEESTETLVEKIRKNIKYHVRPRAHPELKTTLSIGVAAALQGEHFEDTLRRADVGMYKAKTLGKNTIIYTR
ncbi:diguanylate cyclase [Glaciecola sp. MH2013]|uniref:GGDEF domain-containing protein n=1 Tax=Glaciecola sp. MH2013 TaxID=2785524 RepID=UPI00189F8CA2|nr:GGDEF domain-containing protein [Glaciecola sp. MH2013]MBF7072531.1 diguanylate cyclase [Glaciecola sp. MH2013]